MIPVYYYNELTEKKIKELCFRPSFEDPEAYRIANEIIEEIRVGGKEALIRITQRLDHYTPNPLVIEREEFKISEKLLSEEEKKAFQKAAHNIYLFHEFQKKNLKDDKIVNSDITLGYIYRPIKSAGIYVPGGKALYPSSVLMGVIPAKIAGVENITVITPANERGEIHPSILYCAMIAGATSILKVGGAHGIAAAYFGIDVPPAEILIGPGNRFVTAAKSILASTGKVKIDQPAGPSEVLIVADHTANPKFIAADMLAQSEHGEDSISVLLTDSLVLAESVIKEIERGLIDRPSRNEIKKESITKNSYIILFDSFVEEIQEKNIKTVTDNFRKAFDFVNEFAPEHLEICLNIFDEPEAYLEYVHSAGSVFIGKYAPVALGDYFSGTNHILPTGGAAKIYSGVGVETFLKRITWQNTTKQGLKESSEYIDTMSRIEGLEEHGYSIKIRTNGQK
ncbi:MAG: histidinol dehydrogenase [Leptospiraceae bacterium]|nr:histidinol dehydrogenase [Leptospiraceae bacterium]MDW7976298.1 histidinol dehydrogenase [Leptospiraceae bacterium]